MWFAGYFIIFLIFTQNIDKDRDMVRQICNIKPTDMATVWSNELLEQLGLEDLDLILRERRLHWYGHVQHSSGAVKCACDIKVDGKRGPGRPKMSLRELDRREWKLARMTLMIGIPGDLV